MQSIRRGKRLCLCLTTLSYKETLFIKELLENIWERVQCQQTYSLIYLCILIQ